MIYDKNLYRNSEHYADPTAYRAILNADEQRAYVDNLGSDVETILSIKLREAQERERHSKLIGALLRICELSDFQVISHISVRDLRTGREWGSDEH